METRDRRERGFHLPFPFGLIDFEFDRDSLQSQRIVIKRISAIMPGGEEISMPGNAQIPVLDLDDELKEHHEPFLIYLALPLRSEFDGNLAEDAGTLEKRQYSLHETTVNDENTGDNEVQIVRHRQNARLVTEFSSLVDMETIPLMRVIPVYKENMQPKLQLDTDYIPPFLFITGDCPLESLATELDIQLVKRCNKMMLDLVATNYTRDAMDAGTVFSLLQLQTLNRSHTRIHTLLTSGHPTPFEIYLELRVLLGELTVLQPRREIQAIEEYNHLDYAPQFMNLIRQIRLMTQEEGVSGYRKLDFMETADGRLAVNLQEAHFRDADGWYLAITCDTDPRWVISAVERGDKFKMISPDEQDTRMRGVKLTELRYPPRFLPALPDALWFAMEIEETPEVWESIKKESGILLEWGNGLFPKLEAVLFITTFNQEKKA